MAAICKAKADHYKNGSAKIAELTALNGEDRPSSQPMGQSGADVVLKAGFRCIPLRPNVNSRSAGAYLKWIEQPSQRSGRDALAWFASSPENLPLLSLKPMPSLKF